MKKKIFSILALVLCLIPLATLATACGEVNDFVVITNNISTNYKTFAEAFSAAKDGDKIVLHKNAELDSEIVLSKSVILDGQNKYTIKAKDGFVGDESSPYGTEMFFISKNTPNVTLTLRNITLDANKQGRILVAQGGKVIVDGATLTGGLVTNNYVAGVYITHSASFEMTSGNISGNTVAGKYANDNYLQYSADLWIGANATGSLATIKGGKVGNIFVNSNEYSANNAGSFTINGGEVTNLYLEYDKGFGATLNFKSGNIENMLISTTTSGTSVKVTPVENNTYKGGTITPTPIA